MGTLGIYIFNETRNQWYAGAGGVRGGRARWGSFQDAHEFSEGEEEHAEKIRELVSGDDVTFTMAALH